MLLYKFVPSSEIARQVSNGVFRFYDLTKYRKLEENSGRPDPSEGSISFTDEEISKFFDKLPLGSFDGIEFKCANMSLSDEYIKQYFVFCMSTEKNKQVIGDCGYAIELDTDIFDTFDLLFPTVDSHKINADVLKFFSHGPVEYYNIHNHPSPMNEKQWKEVYLKRSDFSYQCEYRAALFVSDHFFERVRNIPQVYERPIFDNTGKPYDFKLKLLARSGIDEGGWRYIELDISEFARNLQVEPSRILTFSA